jgi:hypothetical protein
VVSTTPRPFYPRERPGTHCTGGWVGPRAGLDVCEKSRPHRIFFRSPDRPARIQSLYRLSYPAHLCLKVRQLMIPTVVIREAHHCLKQKYTYNVFNPQNCTCKYKYAIFLCSYLFRLLQTIFRESIYQGIHF